jgi:hypothetical protein
MGYLITENGSLSFGVVCAFFEYCKRGGVGKSIRGFREFSLAADLIRKVHLLGKEELESYKVRVRNTHAHALSTANWQAWPGDQDPLSLLSLGALVDRLHTKLPSLVRTTHPRATDSKLRRLCPTVGERFERPYILLGCCAAITSPVLSPYFARKYNETLEECPTRPLLTSKYFAMPESSVKPLEMVGFKLFADMFTLQSPSSSKVLSIIAEINQT